METRANKNLFTTRTIQWLLFILLPWVSMLNGGPVFAGGGSVCLGRNLSVVWSEHTNVYLTIGDSPPIYFHKPREAPRIVAQGLDLNKRHLVRVYYDGQIAQSWYIDFKKLGTDLVHIWRAKGAYRMEPGRTGECTWPPE